MLICAKPHFRECKTIAGFVKHTFETDPESYRSIKPAGGTRIRLRRPESARQHSAAYSRRYSDERPKLTAKTWQLPGAGTQCRNRRLLNNRNYSLQVRAATDGGREVCLAANIKCVGPGWGRVFKRTNRVLSGKRVEQ